MKKEYKNYLNKDHNFDKSTILGIFCLIIVIAGIFGFLYEVIFYYFNSGMKEIYWRGGNFLPWINIYAIGAILIYLIVPLCFKLAKTMKKRNFLILSYTLCGIFLFDELYNLIFANMLSLPRASEIYKKIGFNYQYFN